MDNAQSMMEVRPWKAAGRRNVGNRALTLSHEQPAKTQLLEASPNGMGRSLSSV